MRSRRSHWQDGSVKLAVANAILVFRRREPFLFDRGDYAECKVEGSYRDRICAYTRSSGKALLVITRRFAASPVPEEVDDTVIILPEGVGREWHDLLTGDRFVASASLRVSDLLATLPVAVLTYTETT
jgi:(1->4)-alpha-D-glucan 1-alpha-D-glucosylmutase